MTQVPGEPPLEFHPQEVDLFAQAGAYTVGDGAVDATVATALPSADITLYPNPEKPASYYVAKDRLELLTARMAVPEIGDDGNAPTWSRLGIGKEIVGGGLGLADAKTCTEHSAFSRLHHLAYLSRTAYMGTSRA